MLPSGCLRVSTMLVALPLGALGWQRPGSTLRSARPSIRPSLECIALPPLDASGELAAEALGAEVYDEHGDLLGRERAVRMIASSVAALQSEQRAAAPPPSLLPLELLPPSMQARRRPRSSRAVQPAWIAAIAAVCLIASSVLPAHSESLSGTVPPPPQQQQQQQLQPGSASVALSKEQVEKKLENIPVTALVNSEGAPYMLEKERNTPLGFFYVDPSDALLDFKVLQQGGAAAKLEVLSLSDVYFPFVAGEKEVGGILRLRPARKQVVFANRAIAANGGGGGFLPTSLDERAGQVPVFYSERVVLQDAAGNSAFPFFFSKDDLDAAYRQQAGGELAAPADPEAGGFAEQPFGGSSSGGSSGQKRRKEAEAQAQALPIGLVRVATLDGLVKQMRSGEIDLRQAVLVGSSDALRASQKLTMDSPPPPP